MPPVPLGLRRAQAAAGVDCLRGRPPHHAAASVGTQPPRHKQRRGRQGIGCGGCDQGGGVSGGCGTAAAQQARPASSRQCRRAGRQSCAGFRRLGEGGCQCATTAPSAAGMTAAVGSIRSARATVVCLAFLCECWECCDSLVSQSIKCFALLSCVNDHVLSRCPEPVR